MSGRSFLLELQDKFAELVNYDSVIPPIESIDFPGMCLQDAGNGVRAAEFASGFPAGISVGARYGSRLS